MPNDDGPQMEDEYFDQDEEYLEPEAEGEQEIKGKLKAHTLEGSKQSDGKEEELHEEENDDNYTGNDESHAEGGKSGFVESNSCI